MSEATKKVHWIVHGRVQGVYFRAFSRQTAQELGLSGWVRNLPDGTVELAAEGSGEALASLFERLMEGPPAARVERIEEKEFAAGELPAPFTVRY